MSVDLEAPWPEIATAHRLAMAQALQKHAGWVMAASPPGSEAWQAAAMAQAAAYAVMQEAMAGDD